jgi:phage-related protein
VIRLANALGAEKLLPETITLKLVPFSLRVPLQHLVGKHGAVVTGTSTIEPRQFSLEGRIYHPGDKERIRQDLDALLAFLMHPPIEVYRQHHHDRFLRAYPLGAPQDWIDGGAELGLQIPMIAHDPYWYGPEVTVNISGTQTITVDGTAPTYPLITTAGSVSSLVVSNALTGQEFAVAGATGVIEVDCDKRNMSVTVDGANRVDLIDDDWVLHSWALLPGENQITTNTPITVTYRPRWY